MSQKVPVNNLSGSKILSEKTIMKKAIRDIFLKLMFNMLKITLNSQ